MTPLAAADIACWVVKSALGPEQLAPGWRPGAVASMTRCLRSSYRLDLMSPGQPCLLWVSGRIEPGVHALGVLAATPREIDGSLAVPVDLTRLADPLPRAVLLADPGFRDAEVLRMPAGSNPSWLSASQFAAVLDRLDDR